MLSATRTGAEGIPRRPLSYARMSRRLRLAVLLLLALAAAVGVHAEDEAAPAPPAPPETPAAAKPEPGKPAGPPTWYAQALARGGAGLNVTHFWSKGPWLRAETVVGGHKVINIVKGPWYYTYDGVTKRGLAIRRDPKAEADDKPDRRPFGREYEILMRQGAELVREEDAIGKKVGVYRVTDMRGKRELIVTQDESRLPLRIEIYDRETTARRYTDYLNWQSALAIPDAFFEPDSDVQIERIELDAYLNRTVHQGPVGAVPVLYADLLHGKHEE
jgi:hypothetical protein